MLRRDFAGVNEQEEESPYLRNPCIFRQLGRQLVRRIGHWLWVLGGERFGY